MTFDSGQNGTSLCPMTGIHLKSDKVPLSMAWSGGKDCTLALSKILSDGDFKVVELHTTVNAQTKRVGMHGVSMELIEAQGHALDLPIVFLEVPSDSSNRSFETTMKAYYRDLKNRGIKHVGFGDIFLEDLKAYRDGLLLSYGLTGTYPIWGVDTQLVATAFIDQGFEAIICAGKQYNDLNSLPGRPYDNEFLRALPTPIDPCGEHGEFHTFVTNGPIFKNRISVKTGTVETHHYHFKDDTGTPQDVAFEFVDLRLV